MTTHQQLAEMYLSQLTLGIRHTTGQKFWKPTDDAHPEFIALIDTIHGDRSRDDYVMQFIHDALQHISEQSDLDYCKLDSNAWSNWEQAMWLASRGDRREYVDNVIQRAEKRLLIHPILERAIDSEMDEVLQQVIMFIENALLELGE